MNQNIQRQDSLAVVLIRFSIPLILSGLLQQMFSWGDAWVLGHYIGEEAIAAIGASTSVTNLFLLAIIGFTSGITILSARYYGAGDEQAQKKLLATFTLILMTVAAAATAAALAVTKPLLRLLDTPANIFDYSAQYLSVFLFGLPFTTLYNIYGAVMRGVGDSRMPFYTVLTAGIMNLVLDVTFVAVFHLGIGGAAAATALSQVWMAFFLMWAGSRKHPEIAYRPSRTLLNRRILGQGAFLALPITIRSVIVSLGNLLLQGFMNGFGSVTVAAITSAYRVDCVLLLPVINLGTGISTITSQNVGAGDLPRARHTLKIGAVLMAGTAAVLAVMIYLFGGRLTALFGITQEAVAIAEHFFRCLAVFYLIQGISTAIESHLQGLGDVIFTGIAGLVVLGCRITLSYTLVGIFDKMTIAYAEGFSWALGLIIMFTRWYLTRNRIPKKLAGE